MFRDKLKELRVSANLTQEELAEKLFVSRSAVAKWEQGRGIPKTDTLEDIANFFNVAIESFYEKDEPQKVIENIEKKGKRNLIIFFSIIVMLVILIIVISLVKINKNKDKTKIEYDMFYTDESLEGYSLKGLEPIVRDSPGSVNWNDNYYINIDSIDVFNEYVSYVLKYLLNSPYISYVGFGIETPTKNSSILDNKTFILTSNNLEDYNESLYLSSRDTNSIHYKFYYLPFLDINHESGDVLDFNYISLHYQKDIQQWIEIDNKQFKTNFRMSIHSSKNYGYGEYYLFDDYFKLEKIIINQDNFSDYFYIDFYHYSSVEKRKVWYYLCYKEYYFKSYLPVTIEIGKDDNFESNSTILRSPNNGNFIELSVLYSEFDYENNEFIYFYNVIVEGGYIYRAISK